MDLLQYLIKKGVINKKQGVQLKAEVEETGKSPEALLLEKKILEELKLFRLKSEFLNIPLKETLPDEILADALAMIPKESVEYYKMVPLQVKKKEGMLEVGMVFPENSQAMSALKFLARQQKLTPTVFLITPTAFDKCFRQYQAPEREVEKALARLEKEMEVERGVRPLEKAEFARLVEEAPVIKMVAVVLRQAVEGKASDIHIEPTRENSLIRYRLDGILYPSLTLPLKAHPAIIARIKILSSLRIDETRIPQDGRFSTRVGERRIDFRVSTFPTTLGEKVAIRVLDPEKGLKSLEGLGLEERNFNLVKATIKKPYGMILVTGPTGSGKTTTLYAILKLLNQAAVNIVTLEDPVEYFMDGINQSQVNPDINYTFARGLRQILRQDPDIIMVGEIRDEETANLAVHAALTGHLVLSTLHTNNAVGAVPRLVDMGVKPFLIPPTLSLVVSQRLVRTLCHDCKQKVAARGPMREYILEKLKNLPLSLKNKLNLKETLYVFQPKGCKKCNQKGYLGRVGVFEVLEMTAGLAKLVSKYQSEQEVLEEARAQQMISMEEDGLLKALRGLTSVEEVMRVAEEK